MSFILKVENLQKSYGKFHAVKGINMQIKKGQVYGILGPNGSGKTTTLGMLLGVIKPDSGAFSWFENGQKDENRKRIGALLETPNFYGYLNAYENLQIVAKIKEIKGAKETIKEVLQKVDLFERGKKKFSTYSLGMKQRLAIASALLGNPEVLVLDEPTNGLDPQGIAEIRTLILSIAKEGNTIIVASHILDEIEKICSHVGIIKEGKIIREGTLDEILTQDKLILLGANDKETLKKIVSETSRYRLIREENDKLLVGVGEKTKLEDINRFFAEKKLFLNHLSLFKKNLETTFLEIINQ